MAFEGLADKLGNAFKKLKNKGKLSEKDVKEAMREVRLALLEADVNYKVAKDFTNKVTERAVGQDVMQSLTPAQMVVKIVDEELTSLMGGEDARIEFASKPPTVIMMCGLQGAGKTTTAAKLAYQFKNKGKKPLLVACDVYRPAAIKQLQINGEKVGVPVFTMGDNHKPLDIAKAAILHAEKNHMNLVFIDTAGRLHVDEDMMDELAEIKENINVTYTVLTVDAMTGQDAVNVATTFNDKIGIDGVILTKLDGDTRGGAALSIKAVTGKPILYAGMGEKLTDLEPFYPSRMASRILGMGDVESLIEKAQNAIDDEKAKEMEQKFRKASFDFNDFMEQMDQLEKMGGIGDLLSMMPGMSSQMKNVQIDEDAGKKPKAIIQSMTPNERCLKDPISPSRKKRIADGAGVQIAEVNRFLKQFEQSKKMMKQMSGMMGGKKRHGGFKLPFGFK